MKKNILLTGEPRSGKSTLLKNLIKPERNKSGFVAEEILEDGKRIGFDVVNHLGNRAILARTDQITPHSVSRYFVQVDSLESLLPSVAKYDDGDLLYIDEIGQMQLYSEHFEQHVMHCLDSPNIVISTISQVYDDVLIQEINDTIFVTGNHGSKKITIAGDRMRCNCPFFGVHSICSHVIAYEEILKAKVLES